MRDCCGICARGYSCGDYQIFSTPEEDVLLPAADCYQGFPESQLKEIFSPETYKAFLKWMVGQTFSSCTGQQYDPEQHMMVDSLCVDNPHGYVYYTGDVARFAAGKKVLDW